MNVSCSIKLFAEGTKCYGTIGDCANVIASQHDSGHVHNWSSKWLSIFNKCNVIHLGRNNTKAIYCIGMESAWQLFQQWSINVTSI